MFYSSVLLLAVVLFYSYLLLVICHIPSIARAILLFQLWRRKLCKNITLDFTVICRYLRIFICNPHVLKMSKDVLRVSTAHRRHFLAITFTLTSMAECLDINNRGMLFVFRGQRKGDAEYVNLLKLQSFLGQEVYPRRKFTFARAT